MCIKATTAAVILGVAVLATIDIRRGGWLDRVVQYKKTEFFKDVRKIAPIRINATIIPAPHGYKDSNRWNFDSVLHLVVLLKHSEPAAPVYRTVRRMMRPSRRIMMGMADSFKHFPSLSKQSLNEFYYDVGSPEDYEEEPRNMEEGVIVVSNPVEARLPSAQISIKLLKDILLARALAAREMPSTTVSTIPWIPMNHTYGPWDGGAGGSGTEKPGNTGAPGDGGETPAGGAEGGGGGDGGTPAGDAGGGAEGEGGDGGEPPADGEAAEPEGGGEEPPADEPAPGE